MAREKSKVIQLPSSTQSYSDLQVLKRNLLDQLVKDKSIKDLGVTLTLK